MHSHACMYVCVHMCIRACVQVRVQVCTCALLYICCAMSICMSIPKKIGKYDLTRVHKLVSICQFNTSEHTTIVGSL